VLVQGRVPDVPRGDVFGFNDSYEAF